MTRLLYLAIATGTMGFICGPAPYLASADSAPLPDAVATYALDVTATVFPPRHRFLELNAYTKVSERREIRFDAGEQVAWQCDDRFTCDWSETCEVTCELRVMAGEGAIVPVFLMELDGATEYRGERATLTLGEWREVLP